MTEDAGHGGDHQLTERINVRLTKNERAWVRSVASGMKPPTTESYVVRACVVGFRQITARPLIESLQPLPPEALGERRQPATTPHKGGRRSV